MSILDFRLLGIKNWSMTGKKMYIDIWKNEAESYRAISSNEFESRGIYLRSIYPEIRSRWIEFRLLSKENKQLIQDTRA